MSNNKYMDHLEESYGTGDMVKCLSKELLISLALVKELQTLNKTLKFALSDADGHEAPLSHLIWAALTEWEPPFST